MQGVRELQGTGVPLDRSEVDTDAMYPAEFEAVALERGYGAALFGRWRLDDRKFVLNRPEFAAGSILFAGPDFGIGSSREQAVWALTGWGFRAVFSARFGDIFSANCARNGVVAGVMRTETVRAFIDHLLARPGEQVKVNVEEQYAVTLDGSLSGTFTMDGFARQGILSGQSELELILSYAAHINEYEQQRAAWMPAFGQENMNKGKTPR